MTETLRMDVLQETRLLGRRVFDLADRAGGGWQAARLCALVRAMLRRVPAGGSPQQERSQLAAAFRFVADAVGGLDALARQWPALAVEASALAAEATELAERLFELLEAPVAI
ncbi:MAG: hypothetical protein KatS3mg102_1746 [Planctomycetota bacterium]|nr:MAG: hypothetical protein KatS3mg102_1746 [Planctomycetota bacterium]